MEIIGSFLVNKEDESEGKIVVSQDVTDYYDGQLNGERKKLNLDSLDGPEVYRTKDPKVFMLEDGSFLKKRGYIVG